jgi:hypothetical protein
VAWFTIVVHWGWKGFILSGIAGVYRSEKYVVVERHRHQFPQQCIWCGRSVAADEVPASPAADGDVKPPICRSCTATRNRLPKSVGFFGIITFAAAPFVYSSFGALVGGALLLTGFIDLVVAWRLHAAASGFQAVRQDPQYVWIGGAHSGFLDAMPSWNGMRLGEMPAHRN